MKKWLSVLLAAVFALTLVCCGTEETKETEGSSEVQSEAETTKAAKNEPAPKEYKYAYTGFKTGITAPTSELPCYVLGEGATVEEMRQMVVQAMHDELTVPWVTPMTLTITSGEKSWDYMGGVVYGGLPYGGPGSSVFSLLLYLNPQTGLLERLDPNAANSTYGNTCSTSVCWGWNAVCASTWNAIATWSQVKANGLYPIGEVDYPDNLANFKTKGTLEIIQENGLQKTLEAYALLQPGFGVVVVGGNIGDHSMMCIQAPTVVRNADGTINAKESTVTIQDQHKQTIIYEENGQKRQICGHASQEYTFETLWNAGYLAIAPKELLGELEYTVPKLEQDIVPTTMEELKNTKVSSNYRICGGWVEVFKGDVVVYRYVETFAHNQSIQNMQKGYKLSNCGKQVEMADEVLEDVEYRVVVKCVNAAGQQLTAADFMYTKPKK